MKYPIQLLLLAAGIIALVGAGSAEDQKPLVVSSVVTTVDGTIHEGEYSYMHDYGSLKLYVNRTAEALYLGVVGNTSGWVGVGVGSLKMDRATIFIGYVDDGGAEQFKIQTGSAHTHGDVSGDVSSTVISHAMTEHDRTTTLEVALKPDAYIDPGQTHLDLIFAAGQLKSFTERHFFRDFLRLNLGSQ